MVLETHTVAMVQNNLHSDTSLLQNVFCSLQSQARSLYFPSQPLFSISQSPFVSCLSCVCQFLASKNPRYDLGIGHEHPFRGPTCQMIDRAGRELSRRHCGVSWPSSSSPASERYSTFARHTQHPQTLFAIHAGIPKRERKQMEQLTLHWE